MLEEKGRYVLKSENEHGCIPTLTLLVISWNTLWNIELSGTFLLGSTDSFSEFAKESVAPWLIRPKVFFFFIILQTIGEVLEYQFLIV